MSAPGAGAVQPANDVLVADSVLAQLDALSPAVQEIVAWTIQDVGRTEGAVPVNLTVPDSPPGAEYMALSTSDPDAPVIIYRAVTSAETNLNGRWLVTTLLSAENYAKYRRIQQEFPFGDETRSQLVGSEDYGRLMDVAVRAVK